MWIGSGFGCLCKLGSGIDCFAITALGKYGIPKRTTGHSLATLDMTDLYFSSSTVVLQMPVIYKNCKISPTKIKAHTVCRPRTLSSAL